VLCKPLGIDPRHGFVERQGGAITMKALFVQIAFLAIAGVLATAPVPALADGDQTANQDQKADNRWHVDLTPYLWAPTVNGSVQYDRASIRSGILPGGPVSPGAPVLIPVPTSGTLDLNIGPNSYFSKINSGALFTMSARRGTGLLFTDIIYLNLSSARNTITNFTGPLGNVNLQASAGTQSRLTGTLWTVGGGYVLAESKFATLYGFGGWRYAGVTSRLDWQFAGPLGILDRTGSAARSVSLDDALVGVRGQVHLSRRLYIPYYADIGAGSSNTTWQAVGGIGYGNVAIVFRNLQYNMTGENAFPSLRLSGVAIAGTFRF
jgi:hypothetical protein